MYSTHFMWTLKIYCTVDTNAIVYTIFTELWKNWTGSDSKGPTPYS